MYSWAIRYCSEQCFIFKIRSTAPKLRWHLLCCFEHMSCAGLVLYVVPVCSYHSYGSSTWRQWPPKRHLPTPTMTATSWQWDSLSMDSAAVSNMRRKMKICSLWHIPRFVFKFYILIDAQRLYYSRSIRLLTSFFFCLKWPLSVRHNVDTTHNLSNPQQWYTPLTHPTSRRGLSPLRRGGENIRRNECNHQGWISTH